jgi:hypothetical protein
MWTYEKVQKFIKEYGFRPFNTKREIRDLAAILRPNEELISVLEGYFKKLHNTSVNGYGLVVATDSRVIFYRRGVLNFVTMHDIPLNKISSVSYRKGWFFSSIVITTSGKELMVNDCNKKLGYKFTEILQQKLAEDGNKFSNDTDTISTSVLEQLEILHKMWEVGDITEEEYRKFIHLIFSK